MALSQVDHDGRKDKMQVARLAMGCFWSPEALFGALPGVISTRTGYAGGKLEGPTYRQMGDHSESVELYFDPGLISYEELLRIFWRHHTPEVINDYKGRQYRSLLLYSGENQRKAALDVSQELASASGRAPATELLPFEAFYPAEDRHQKYYLKRFPDAMGKLEQHFASLEHLQRSTLAARLNGLAKGFTNRERILLELQQWDVSGEEKERIQRLITSIRW